MSESMTKYEEFCEFAMTEWNGFIDTSFSKEADAKAIIGGCMNRLSDELVYAAAEIEKNNEKSHKGFLFAVLQTESLRAVLIQRSLISDIQDNEEPE